MLPKVRTIPAAEMTAFRQNIHELTADGVLRSDNHLAMNASGGTDSATNWSESMEQTLTSA